MTCQPGFRIGVCTINDVQGKAKVLLEQLEDSFMKYIH